MEEKKKERKQNPQGFRNPSVKARNNFRRKERREAAEARNAKWQALPLEERLKICIKSPFGRAKEILKLKAKIAKGGKS
jgi:hypothetical protein